MPERRLWAIKGHKHTIWLLVFQDIGQHRNKAEYRIRDLTR